MRALYRPLAVAIAAVPFLCAGLSAQRSLDPTVTLSVPAAAVASPVTLDLYSPYGARPFSVRARGPSGNAFEVASGVTDPFGRAELELRLVEDPSLAGVDLALRAEVEDPSSGRFQVSPWEYFRVASGETAERVPFSLEDTLIPATRILSDAGELFDVDVDGDLDVLLVSAAPQTDAGFLRLLINDGSGGLAEESGSRIPVEEQLAGSEITIADVNGDGAVDFFLAAAIAAEDNALFLNDGSGHFARQESFPGKSEESLLCNAAAFGDFDGDGDLDLFLANGITSGHDGEAVLQRNELLLGDGDGNFVVPEGFLVDDILNAPAVSRAVATGDLDGDGNLDLVVGNAGPNLLLLGDGSGGFADYPENWPETEDSTYGVAVEDIDLDGDLDIVYANTAFNPFAQAILLNQGGRQEGVLGEFQVGSFPVPVEGQSAVRLGLLTCDVDADGDIDVLYPIHEFGAGERPDLYLNQGGLQGGEVGTFVLDASFESIPGVYRDLSFGDLDGDGDGDLLAPMSSTFDPEGNAARTYILLSDVFQAPNAPLAFRRGDSNGDLSHDLSDAVFVLGHLFGGGASPGCLAAADVDDSGAVDISDAVAQLNHFFAGGPPPASPYPGFGDAPGPLLVGCERVPLFE